MTAGQEPDVTTDCGIPLEVFYTIVPIALVAVLFVYTYQAENKEDNVSPNPALVVRVDAFQWGWRFTYPQRLRGHR